MTLYIATSNPGKLAEFRAAAGTLTIESLPGLATLPSPVEDAPTFLGNAEIKAVAYSQASPGLLVLCDDSGLEVAALHGAPGVRSARFAEDADCQTPLSNTADERNNLLLLDRLDRTPARTARFVCALALARDGQVLLRSEGVCEGEILREPRGTAGFGYDPLFLLPELGKTLAELAREAKWRVSHRGRAFGALLDAMHAAGTDL